jgi:hypothetical protein
MAPYKSEAQRRKFHELLKEGKIDQTTVDEWDRETDRKKLLPRVKPKNKPIKVKYAKIIK